MDEKIVSPGAAESQPNAFRVIVIPMKMGIQYQKKAKQISGFPPSRE